MGKPNFALTTDYSGIDDTTTWKKPDFTLNSDFGYSADTKYDYYQLKLAERKNLLDQQIQEPDTPEDEPAIIQFAKDTRDAWRTFFKKKDEVKLTNKLELVRTTEGTYMNGIDLALNYLHAKASLIELQLQFEANKDKLNPLMQQSVQLEILDQLSYIKQLEDGLNVVNDEGEVVYHQPGLKELARTNPYLQDIFYETTPGVLFANDEHFGKLSDLAKYYTFDWLAEDKQFTDWNPGNNFKHMLEHDGIQDPIFGRTHRLSQDQIDYMWSLKNTGKLEDIQRQQRAIEENYGTAKAILDDKNHEIQELQHTLKHGNWIYNPSKIDPRFTYEQEHNDIKWNSPKSWLMAVPEAGTSWSEWLAMLGQMGVSMLLNAAAKSALVAGTGGTAALLLAATEVAAQAAITNYTRTLETNSEVFDAFSNKVLQGVDELGINLPDVLDQAKSDLNELGFKTDEMTDFEVLLTALSQNIETDDDEFNYLTKEANKGLDVVRLTNQALMMGDLAEGLYSFGGKYLKGFAGLNVLRRTAYKQLGERATEQLMEAAKDRVAQTALKESAQGLIDRTIARGVNKVFKEAGNKVLAHNVINNFGKLGRRLGVTYFMEKTEEGQQYVVSRDYQKGKYDNVEGYNFLDGLANDFKMAGEAWLAYYGLHSDKLLNSDKDLIHAMEIGGFTGLLMGGAFQSPSIYKATKQALTDTKLRTYIADGYANGERDNKVEQFMRADNRKKGGYARIRQNLETLKANYKPEGITDEMIDEDIALVNSIERLSTNKNLLNIANQLDIKREDDDFIRVVKNGIAVQDRLKDAQEASNQATTEINNILEKIKGDKDLLLEIQQQYVEYKRRYDKKRSERRRNIVADLPAKEIESRNRKELSEYVESLLPEYKPLTEQEFTDEYLGRIAAIQDYNDLLRLRDELYKRKQDLQSLKDDRGLDVNVKGISGIIKYVETQLKQRKKLMDRLAGLDVGELILENGLSAAYTDELTKANMTKYINDGVRADLFAHALAYTTGKYVGDPSLYQDAELTAKEDKKANEELVQRDRAKRVVAYDLRNRKTEEIETREEISEETGGLPELLNEGTPSSDESMSEPLPTPVEEKPEPTDKKLELEDKLDDLDKAIEGEPLTDKSDLAAPLDEMAEEEVETHDSTESEDQDIEDRILLENPPTVEVEVQPTDLAEEVSPAVTPTDIATEENPVDTSSDVATEEKEVTEPVVPEEEPTTTEESAEPEEVHEEKSTPEETPTPKEEVIEVTDTPGAEDITPTVVNPVVDEVDVSSTPGADELMLDRSTEEVAVTPGGNQLLGRNVANADMLLQDLFDDEYDPDLEGPASHQNNSNDYKAAHRRFRKLHIKDTFFYQPETDEIMPITVAGLPVTFTGIDGKPVERRPGKELAEKLAIPGWLSSVDDAYLIVTSSTHQISSFDSAIDNLAIHLMIEKDGKLYNTSLRAIDDALRNRLRDTDMTEEEVDSQISDLRALRAKIILAYAPEYVSTRKLPTEAKKHVKPVGLRISNGRIRNEVTEDGLPSYRHLTEVADFGISSDPLKMTEQLLSGEVQIGYGTGPFGVSPFEIDDMLTHEHAEIEGTGYAGKLYLLLKPQNTPSGSTTIPVMLAEELHRIPGVENPKDIELVYDTKSWPIKGKENVKPSNAELIFQLLLTSTTHFRTVAQREVDAYFLSLMANTGPHTVFDMGNLENRQFNFLVRKTLHAFTNDKGKSFLINGFHSTNKVVLTANGPRVDKVYKLKYTNLDTLTEYEKKQIVWEISLNVHWNTDKDVLMNRFPEVAVKAIIAQFNRQGLTSADATINMYNSDALSFTLRDIGYDYVDGKVVKAGEAPLVMAWAINHGIIKTDVGNHVFAAPFVYSNEVTVNNDVKQRQAATKAELKPVEPILSPSKPSSTPEVTESKAEEQKPVKTPENASQQAKSYPKAIYAELATPENLAKYGLTIPDNGFRESQYLKWGIVIDPRDNQRKVVLTPVKFIKGLKSTTRGKGSLDAVKAKEWLLNKLGIDADLVLVTEQLVKSGANELAYGLFSVVMDAITGQLMPQISLSKLSGKGVEYHEAFHYVTQLLLDELQRNALYQEYVKANKSASNLSKDEVEELLAEEFRKYTLDRNRNGLLYRVIRFFKGLLNLVLFWNSHKRVLRAFFKSINDGAYSNIKPNKDALESFYKRHTNGLSYYVPGLSKNEEAKLPHITDPDTFYHVVHSLSSGALAAFNIRTMADVERLNINQLFDQIESNVMFGWVNELNAGIVNDVLNNRLIFGRYVKEKLKQLNIRLVDRVETEEDRRVDVETGEASDNTWDRKLGEVSKKDNVGFRAKLFFYSIPKYEYLFNTDETTGVTTRDLVPVFDDLFNLPLTYDFNYAWNQIMENLWDIDNFNDIVERSAVLGKTNEFFQSLHDILTSTESPLSDNTKTQLEVTIKSAKLQLDTIKTSHPAVDTRGKSDELIASDISASMKLFNWEVIDSDNLRKIQRLPSRWSSAFFASSAIERDSNGRPHISKQFASYLTQKRGRVAAIIKAITTRKGKHLAIDPLKVLELKESIIDVFNALSIPMDVKTLDYILLNNTRGFTEFDKLNYFWKGIGYDKTGKFNEGTIANILHLARTGDIGIRSSQGKGYIRTLDRLFTIGRDARNQMTAVAIAYGKVHPSPQEFSVTGADGSLIYPISENNYMTDQLRNINKDLNGKKQLLLNTPFSKRSLIANANTPLKLHTFLMLDMDDGGRDYFSITPVEDYISKLVLTHNDRIILPTMSDKPTWYSISGIRLVHDQLLSFGTDIGEAAYEAITDKEANEETSITPQNRRFSAGTLNIFANYWLDEFEAVWDYFKHKEYVEQHPTQRVDNYHGKIKNGKMDHTGNGGRFRYFTNLTVGDEVLNVNQELARLELYGTTLDVFNYLSHLKVLLLNTVSINGKELIKPNSLIYHAINNLLIDATEREMRNAVKLGVLGYSNGLFTNKVLPNNIVNEYSNSIGSSLYGVENAPIRQQDILYSIIGSHVANQAISIMEVEKCFTGDPAYYKWKTKKQKVGDNTINIITAKDVDKIKRLSSVLSTGSNLRTVWDNPAENDTRITVMHLADNMVSSDYYGKLKGIFRNAILRDLYSQQNPKLTDNEVIEALDSTDKEDAFYNTLDDQQKKFVDDYTEASASPYGYTVDEKGKENGNINQADAAVYIRPAMYRRIAKALGQWSDAIEEAYQIMEGEDQSWLEKPEVYQKVLPLVVKPLKMVYFGDHREDNLNLNIPVFDKMALFPLFKAFASGDSRVLYDRMNNEELGTIDMVTFESAVKVGGRPKYQAYTDHKNTTLNEADLNKKSYNLTQIEGDLPVFYQDIRNLRLQLNTDPHQHIDRSFGTQAAKICLGNLIDDRSYGNNKGIDKTGSLIKIETIDAINELADLGYREVRDKFFYHGKLNNKALSDYLVEQALNSGMSTEFIKGLTLDENGEIAVPLAALSTRQWIESKIISFINKNVIDINTPGGSAIQCPSFMMKATGARTEGDLSRTFNGGKKLRFLNEDGSIDVVLSTNFFRHVVPKEYLKSYGMMRQWLVDHNIIGENAIPQGVGYRIPTQGLSSTFSMKVVDVLPDRFGDTIIVPDEFTAMTGSDFDIDKLYIAVLNYDENGNIVQFDGEDTAKQSKEALLNRIILNYQLVISDNKNMAETRASIDTLTNILKDEIIPLLTTSSKSEALPFYELLPSFQEARKQEYTSGKAGIAPFALNSTNHCLTQLTHLSMQYSNPEYGLSELDAIKGQDGFRILDWLSAMINAHVDVAKDPYVFTLNINRVTYNMVNFLLRAGKGKNTFLFLAQPILKDFANRVLSSKGNIGVEDTGGERAIIRKEYTMYATLLKLAIDALDEGSYKQEWQAKFNGLADELNINTKYDIKKNSIEPNKADVFNEDSLTKSLKNISADNLDFLYQQLLVMRAYAELSNDARILNELVQRSLIDTKKFGNSLAQLMNFLNSYETFIYDNTGKFKLTNSDNTEPLKYYFDHTFLSKKLKSASSLVRKVLKSLTFPATWTYQNIFNSVMGDIVGSELIVNTKGEEVHAYKHQSDKDFIKLVNSAIESIIRARVSANTNLLDMTDEQYANMFVGANSMCARLTKLKLYLLLNKDRFQHLVTPDGTIRNELLNYLLEYPADNLDGYSVDRIVLSESSMNNDYDRENQLISAFAQLLEDTDDTVRNFAEDLVKYAYATSYDERGPNSFFHLVPLQYKIDNGYVNNIKDALAQFKDGTNTAGYNAVALEGDDPASMSFPSIRLTIARNYWDDTNVVHRIPLTLKHESVESPDTEDRTTYDNILSRSTVLVGNRTLLRYDAIAFPAYKTRDAEFITVVNGSGINSSIELYQLIGKVALVDEEGKPAKRGARNVYKRIPKLGIKQSGIRINEFLKSGYAMSAFDLNAFGVGAVTEDETIADLALTKVKLPKVKGKSYLKSFIPLGSSNIAIKILATNESLNGDPSAVQEVNASTPEFDEILAQEAANVDDFVNIETSFDFDATPGADLIEEQLDIFDKINAELASQPNEETPTDNVTDVFDMGALTELGEVNAEDMSGLAELGQQRKEECK